MAIAKRPKRNLLEKANANSDERAEAFIAGAGKQTTEQRDRTKRGVLLRIDPEILARLDKEAKRLGISRAGFIVSSAVKELERLD